MNNDTKRNNYHPTIKFTAEISDTKTTFLETCIYEGARFEKDAILDVHTHFKRLRHFSIRILVPVTQKLKKGFIKGERRGPKTSQDKLSV